MGRAPTHAYGSRSRMNIYVAGLHLIASLKCKIVNLHSLKLPAPDSSQPFLAPFDGDVADKDGTLGAPLPICIRYDRVSASTSRTTISREPPQEIQSSSKRKSTANVGGPGRLTRRPTDPGETEFARKFETSTLY